MGKILIVDDSFTMRESLTLVLENAGHFVWAAVNGLDGLDMYNKNTGKYDLIITDINMPEMNGLDFIINLRRINTTIPIVVLTTETEKDKMAIAKDNKASAWMVKPFKPNDLLSVVNKIISKSGGR